MAKTERASSRDRRPPSPPRTNAHKHKRTRTRAEAQAFALCLLPPEARQKHPALLKVPPVETKHVRNTDGIRRDFCPTGFATWSMTPSSLFTCPPHVHLPAMQCGWLFVLLNPRRLRLHGLKCPGSDRKSLGQSFLVSVQQNWNMPNAKNV